VTLFDRVRMLTGYGEYIFATHIVPYANENIDLQPHFEPNRIKVYVAPNASNVYRNNRKVTGKTPYGVVYYQGGLASEWTNEDIIEEWYRPGFELAGYSTNPKADPYDEDLLTIDNLGCAGTSGSATVYCIWKPLTYEIKYYDATIYENGKEREEATDTFGLPMNVTRGESLVLPKMEKEGYDFLGWKFADEDDYNKVTKKNGYIIKINATNCSNVSLYPEFRRITYDLVFNAQGGNYKGKKTGVIGKNLDYSADVLELVSDFNSENFVKKGYKLQGFSLDKNCRSGFVLKADGKPAYSFGKLVLNGRKKVTLYAIWEKQ
jgi:hypothetical protein